MKLQVALDFTNIEQALCVAREVCDFVDIIEAGTPLIKSCGMRAVKELKALGKEVFADTKTVDAIELEAELAKSHGGDFFSVLASAPEKVLEKSREIEGIKKALDMIGALSRAEEIKNYVENFDVVILHTGIDEGFFSPEMYRNTGFSRIAVAGGIDIETIDFVLSELRPEIVIIGRGITRAENPREAAKRFREVLECL